jgi:hypothetical protein
MNENEENPSYRAAFIIIAAFVIAAGAIAAYVWFARVPTPYAGEVLSRHIYPIHRDLSQPSSTEGLGGQNEVYDEVIVLADVRIQNVSKNVPLFLHDMSAVVTLPDESDRSTNASASDFDKVFIAYPDLQPFKKTPLPRDLTLQPGQQVEGQMIFNYQMPQAQFDTRTGMDINIDFVHQTPLTLHIAK